MVQAKDGEDCPTLQECAGGDEGAAQGNRRLNYCREPAKEKNQNQLSSILTNASFSLFFFSLQPPPAGAPPERAKPSCRFLSPAKKLSESSIHNHQKHVTPWNCALRIQSRESGGA